MAAVLEAILSSLFGVYKRYHAPMARTVLLGKPDQLKIDTMKKTIEALETGISAVKPLDTCFSFSINNFSMKNNFVPKINKVYYLCHQTF